MGKLDEGGSRGQCSGLFNVLNDIACRVAQSFGNVIRLSEDMFDVSTLDAVSALINEKKEGDEKEIQIEEREEWKNVEVDLVTAGVWVPIATALMADSKIQMSIFSPGIATILQVRIAK